MKRKLLPIGVDLDGTLVSTDTLFEAALKVIKKNPLLIIYLFVWLTRGKIYFKNQIVPRAQLLVEKLPYNEELLEYLRAELAKGRQLYLMTAAHPRIAAAVAQHLGIFAGVLASSEMNLAGPAKAAAAVERFGVGGYFYAGNSRVDVPVWEKSAGAIVVNASGRVCNDAKGVAPIVLVIPPKRLTWLAVCRLLRCHQWVKNILVFVPMITAHAVSADTVILSGLAFIAFCFISSSGYVVNDVLDMEIDRQHHTKHRRLFAAGDAQLWLAVVYAPLLLAAGIGLGWQVSPAFVLWLLAYFVMTAAYSIYLKRLLLFDVVILGALYTLRIFAGATAVAVSMSAWLLVFSLFLFMSLAFVKRFVELNRLSGSNVFTLVGRAYHRTDATPIGSLGIASGYAAALVLALYISSDEITFLYRQPFVLWLLVPVLVYWLSRLWILAYRNELHDDPVVFAMRDRLSYILLAMSLIMVYVAI